MQENPKTRYDILNLNNFPSGTTIGVVNTVSIVRTNWEVGITRITRASSDLLDDTYAISIIQRFYDTSSPTFSLTDVDLNNMPGLSHQERQAVKDYLLRNLT